MVDRFRAALPDGYIALQGTMQFWSDLITRVELVSSCYQRLYDLTPIFQEVFRNYRRKGIDLKSPFVTGFSKAKASPATRALSDQAEFEANAMTALVFYELKSIVAILGQVGIKPLAGSEIEYLVNARDKILAHPQLRFLRRASPHSSSYPLYEGVVRKQVASVQVMDQRIRSSI